VAARRSKQPVDRDATAEKPTPEAKKSPAKKPAAKPATKLKADRTKKS